MATMSPPAESSMKMSPADERSSLPSSTARGEGQGQATNPDTAPSVLWGGGMPMLQLQDAVVETVVTRTTRVTTSLPPIVLPRVPSPDDIGHPSHLQSEHYPLSKVPCPPEVRQFTLNIAGRRVVYQDPSPIEANGSRSRPVVLPRETAQPDDERINLAQAINRSNVKELRKRPLDRSRPPSALEERPPITATTSVKSPPISGISSPRRVEPPRKKSRGLSDIAIPPNDHQSGLISPLPSPDELSPRAGPAHVPSFGSGHEMATLVSLPGIVAHFDQLPDKLQQHVLMQMLRRSRMPTIQRVTAFASLALKRDFISLLPHEIAVHILRHVDVKSLLRATLVCRKWRKMIDGERTIWRDKLDEDDMWYGHGVDQEEEELLEFRRRMLSTRTDDSPRSARRLKAETPTTDGDDSMRLDSAKQPDFEDTIMKHMYRRRYTSAQNWSKNVPHQFSFNGHGTNVITCLQFDDDKIVSASDDHSVNVYDMRSGRLRKRFDGHEGGIWALQFKDDILVTGSTDRSVRIWDTELEKETHCFLGHQSTVRCLQIIEPVLDEETGEFQPPVPLIVTGSRDSTLRIWKLPRKGETMFPYRQTASSNAGPLQNSVLNGNGGLPPDENPWFCNLLEGHSQAVRALQAHGRICVSGSYDMSVRVWDIITGKCLHTLTGHGQRVYSVAYDHLRKRCVSGAMDNCIKVWDLATGTCIHTVTGHTSLVGLLSVSAYSLVSGGADATIRVWDAENYQLRHTLVGHPGAITCFHYDNNVVASGSDNSLKLWDIRTGAHIRDLVANVTSVWQVKIRGPKCVTASIRSGQTVFDVFDFAPDEKPHPSGLDDPQYDHLRRPAWERKNRLEPQTYQDMVDDSMDLEHPRNDSSHIGQAVDLALSSTTQRSRGRTITQSSSNVSQRDNSFASWDPRGKPVGPRVPGIPSILGIPGTGREANLPSGSRARFRLARRLVLDRTSPSPAGPSSAMPLVESQSFTGIDAEPDTGEPGSSVQRAISLDEEEEEEEEEEWETEEEHSGRTQTGGDAGLESFVPTFDDQDDGMQN